jgi:hypothetical protein
MKAEEKNGDLDRLEKTAPGIPFISLNPVKNPVFLDSCFPSDPVSQFF